MPQLHDNMYDIAIIGGGPTGLACAIEATKNNLLAIVIEKGTVADSIRRFPVNMTFFSTADLLELDNIPFTATGARPTRTEAVKYYQRVSERMGINVLHHTRVLQIIKNDESSLYSISTDNGSIIARTCIVATGYFDTTNSLNVPGEHLPHVHRYYTEGFAYHGAKVVVIGGKNSAVETALDLWRHGADVTIVHRRETLGASVKYWIKPDIENRLKNGEIHAHFSSVVTKIENGAVHIKSLADNSESIIPCDFVIPHIGYRPDATLLRGAGIEVDDTTCIPTFDPETFESNVRGLYLAGSVQCGCESWNIFIENGRAHAQPIITHIITHIMQTHLTS
ncbi:MAG: YpdA family putative bacillithiol disulfide reductase [Candidatus Kapabacteria bacterium]|nr:YpdA family putative bacillithiol disulfide reductase [Candidatus Kapabacteria bacterium]